MNEKLDTRYLNKLLKVGVTLLVFACLVWVFNQVGAVAIITKVAIGLIPVVIAIALAYILEPVIGLLTRIKITRVLAVIIVYCLVVLIIAAIIYFVIPGIVAQLNAFFESLPQISAQVDELLTDIGGRVGIEIKGAELIDDLLGSFSQNIINNIYNITNIVFIILIAFTGSVFLSFDFAHFKKHAVQVLKWEKENRLYSFIAQLAPAVHRYTVGLIIDNFILFLIAIICFYFAGAPYPVLFALIIALTNFIPLIGQFIGGTPIVLIGFATSLSMGITYLIIIVVLQFFESNVMQPIMLRQALKIRPIENLIAVAICGSLMGIVGMIIAPFFVILVKIIIKEEEKKRKRMAPAENPSSLSENNKVDQEK